MDGWMDVCMHVCMYVYMCIYVHIYIYACIFTLFINPGSAIYSWVARTLKRCLRPTSYVHSDTDTVSVNNSRKKLLPTFSIGLVRPRRVCLRDGWYD